MKLIKAIRTIFDVIVVLFAVFCISIFLFIKITGMEILVVQSGSMEPTINVDDIVIIQPITISEAKNDDIITYKDGDTFVTHRVIEVISDKNGLKLRMKGDNNNTEDKIKVDEYNIVGKYVTHISNAADTYYFIKSPYGIITILGVPILLYMLINLIIYIKTPEDDKFKIEEESSNNLDNESRND